MLHPDFTNATIQSVITNLVGNKTREEGFVLSDRLSEINAESLAYFREYFLEHIPTTEFYSFHHPVDLEMNEVYTLVKQLFEDNGQFVATAQHFTKLLYDASLHPKINNGELNVVLFDNILLEDEIVEAIGIYKSESNVPFISMAKNTEDATYQLQHQMGYELKGIDKACLIMNTNQERGFYVFIVDKKSGDAHYWREDFLKINPVNSDFTETRAFMDMTKTFVTKQIHQDVEIDNPGRIDLLNKTMDYFKSNERFDKAAFEESVLEQSEVIESFRNFAPSYSEEKQVEFSDSFDISDQAVKKQVRKFKRVLKLDKNFHIYIHGDKSLIDKGVEPDGRKFYKIYYEEEA